MPRFRALLFLSLLLLPGIAAKSQALSSTMPRKTQRTIVDQAKLTFNKYIAFLNEISAPPSELPGEDLDLIIDRKFSNDDPNRIFYDYGWEIDRDEYGDSPEKADKSEIKVYLQSFRNYYRRKNDHSIAGKINEDVSKIYIGKEHYFIRIYFRQTMDGVNMDDKPYPKETQKYMDLQIVPKYKEFQALISRVGFVENASKLNDVPVVRIGDAFDVGLSSRQYSPAYYQRQLENGRRSLADQRFDEAYVALKNAQKSPQLETEASRLINGVDEGLRAKKLVPSEYLYDHLTARGEVLRDKYRYAESRKYFEYAKEVKPTAKQPVIALEAISKDEKSFLVIEELLNKGAYQKAIGEYTVLWKTQSDNPQVHVGLARAYTGLGKYSLADSFYKNAIHIAPSYPDIYLYQANFYERQSDYDRAYESLRLAQEYTDDPGDPGLLSDVAYFKGRALWAKRQPGAVDSLKAAIAYLETNVDAQIALAEVLSDQGDTKEARQQIDRVLKMEEVPAAAYRTSGLIYRRQEKWDEAISDYLKAVSLEQNNIRWQYELAELLMEQTEPRPADARDHLNVCISTPVTVTNIVEARQLETWQQRALLLRARCHYYETKNVEAEADFKDYFKLKRFPDDESYACYALLLIRLGRTSEAVTELAKAKGQTPNVLFARSILAFIQHDRSYESLFEDALDRGLKRWEITNAPKVEAMAGESKKVKDLLKARRGIRY